MNWRKDVLVFLFKLCTPLTEDGGPHTSSPKVLWAKNYSDIRGKVKWVPYVSNHMCKSDLYGWGSLHLKTMKTTVHWFIFIGFYGIFSGRNLFSSPLFGCVTFQWGFFSWFLWFTWSPKIFAEIWNQMTYYLFLGYIL